MSNSRPGGSKKASSKADVAKKILSNLPPADSPYLSNEMHRKAQKAKKLMETIAGAPASADRRSSKSPAARRVSSRRMADGVAGVNVIDVLSKRGSRVNHNQNRAPYQVEQDDEENDPYRPKPVEFSVKDNNTAAWLMSAPDELPDIPPDHFPIQDPHASEVWGTLGPTYLHADASIPSPLSSAHRSLSSPFGREDEEGYAVDTTDVRCMSHPETGEHLPSSDGAIFLPPAGVLGSRSYNTSSHLEGEIPGSNGIYEDSTRRAMPGSKSFRESPNAGPMVTRSKSSVQDNYSGVVAERNHNRAGSFKEPSSARHLTPESHGSVVWRSSPLELQQGEVDTAGGGLESPGFKGPRSYHPSPARSAGVSDSQDRRRLSIDGFERASDWRGQGEGSQSGSGYGERAESGRVNGTRRPSIDRGSQPDSDQLLPAQEELPETGAHWNLHEEAETDRDPDQVAHMPGEDGTGEGNDVEVGELVEDMEEALVMTEEEPPWNQSVEEDWKPRSVDRFTVSEHRTASGTQLPNFGRPTDRQSRQSGALSPSRAGIPRSISSKDAPRDETEDDNLPAFGLARSYTLHATPHGPDGISTASGGDGGGGRGGELGRSSTMPRNGTEWEGEGQEIQQMQQMPPARRPVSMVQQMQQRRHLQQQVQPQLHQQQAHEYQQQQPRAAVSPVSPNLQYQQEAAEQGYSAQGGTRGMINSGIRAAGGGAPVPLGSRGEVAGARVGVGGAREGDRALRPTPDRSSHAAAGSFSSSGGSSIRSLSSTSGAGGVQRIFHEKGGVTQGGSHRGSRAASSATVPASRPLVNRSGSERAVRGPEGAAVTRQASAAGPTGGKGGAVRVEVTRDGKLGSRSSSMPARVVASRAAAAAASSTQQHTPEQQQAGRPRAGRGTPRSASRVYLDK